MLQQLAGWQVSMLSVPKGVIGMVHAMPLIGYKDHPGYEAVERAVIQDAAALEDGGVDAIMLENNYDLPHREFVEDDNAQMLLRLAKTLRSHTDLPLGLCVLWNDYSHAFEIAQKADFQFVRVPVFVDSVKTDYGVIEAHPEVVIAERLASAPEVALLVDVQVKHATMLSERPIAESAQASVDEGANGLIVTGRWTADLPDPTDLDAVSDHAGNASVYVGSGATARNAHLIKPYCAGVIVGTTLKEGSEQSAEQETNIKSFDQRVERARVEEFCKAWNQAAA